MRRLFPVREAAFFCWSITTGKQQTTATYGKGKIQTTVPLIEDALLQFTIAHWLSPSGEWYEGRGVAPDITVSDDPDTEGDEALQFALDYMREEMPP